MRYLMKKKGMRMREICRKTSDGTKLRQSAGNIGGIMTTGICAIALTIIVLSYFDCIGLVQQKTQVGQLAREYILRMETVGYLTAEEQVRLTNDLRELGVTDVELKNTTLRPGGYGQEIELNIRGKLKGEYEFHERRVSTAKY